MKNVFRIEYRQLTSEESLRVSDIKDVAQKLYDLFDGALGSACTSEQARQIALAKTNLEQSVMWGVKAITGPVAGGESVEEK